MLHSKRRWCVFDREELEQLCEELTSRTWVLCNGIRWRGLLILNDATTEDALQEYAVINEKSGAQIESLTVSWFKPEDLVKLLTDLSEGREWCVMTRTWTKQRDPRKRIETLEQHRKRRCGLCA